MSKSNSIEPTNQLYYGDNLEVLRRHVEEESVDLVYLDPPFKSSQNYNVLFEEKDGSASSAQIQVFEDTWHWDQSAAEAYQEVVEAGGGVSEAMQAFRTFLGDNDMMAYLAMMAPRLVELRRVMRSTGSIFLHCDPTASHYLKMLMDSIFGADQFRNEIVWRRMGSHNARRTFGPIHDIILFYSKSNDYQFHTVRRPYMKGHVESRYSRTDDGRYKFTSGGNVLTGAGRTEGDSGKEWRGFDPSAKNRHWAVPGYYESQMPPEYKDLPPTEKLEALYKAGHIEVREGNAWPIMVRYLDERDGVPIQDIWSYQPYTEGTLHGTNEGIDADVAWMGPTDPERLGYPTQKPQGLLHRIIRATTTEGDTVLDPFCGCGTTIISAQELHRQWIGIDITHLAVTLMKHRLHDTYGHDIPYTVLGEPKDLTGARELAADDPYQFQWWALGLLGARPVEQKKGADRGIDGRLYFHAEGAKGKTNQVIFSVKAGKTGVSHVRDLRGVIEREKAAIGCLITMQEPTQPMRREAANAGFYTSHWGKHPRLQIFTIRKLLEGKRLDAPPPRQVNVTFRRAQKAKKKPNAKQLRLGD